MLSAAAVRLLPFNIMAVARGVSPWTLLRHRDGSWSGRGQHVFLTNRAELDAHFWRFVITAGVPFRRISGVVRLKVRESYCDLHTSERELLRAAHVVAADGSNSTLRRLCCPGDRPRQAVALECDVPVLAPVQTCPVGFDFSTVPDGYVWYFPKGDHLNVGVASFREAKLDGPGFRTLLGRFVGEQARSLRIHGAPLDTCDGEPRLAHAGRVLFAGDAAGIVDPVSGEGIFEALYSGKACAQALLRAPGDPMAAYHDAMAGLLASLDGRIRLAAEWYEGDALRPMAISLYE